MITLKIERKRDMTQGEKDYQKELMQKSFSKGLMYDDPYDNGQITENTLTAEITEEQFNSIRKAVLDIF